MNRRGLLKLLLPIGLLCIAASFIVTHYFKVPDFFEGFMLGFGITLIIGSLFTAWLKKPSV